MNIDRINLEVGPYAARLAERRYGRGYREVFNPDWSTERIVERIVEWIGNSRDAARVAHDELALVGMYPRWSSVFVRLPMLEP